jgi:hypothetical protein
VILKIHRIFVFQIIPAQSQKDAHLQVPVSPMAILSKFPISGNETPDSNGVDFCDIKLRKSFC